MRTTEQILRRMKTHNTLVCCGLDPDLGKFPAEIKEKKTTNEQKVFDFLSQVVDEVATDVCCFKAQKAFFDLLSGGHDVLKALVDHVHKKHPGVAVIVDCKINDIDNTMDAYLQNLFTELGADGVVVNPYMGDDTMMPCAHFGDKAIVVLVKTSNLSGGIIQDVLLQSGSMLWQHILHLVVNRWNHAENMIPVISSTAGVDMLKVRLSIPDKMPVLLAGVGAQGGLLTDLGQLLNSEGIGVFANSSRGILYPQSQKHWLLAVKESAVELKNTLNTGRMVQ